MTERITQKTGQKGMHAITWDYSHKDTVANSKKH